MQQRRNPPCFGDEAIEYEKPKESGVACNSALLLEACTCENNEGALISHRSMSANNHQRLDQPANKIAPAANIPHRGGWLA